MSDPALGFFIRREESSPLSLVEMEDVTSESSILAASSSAYKEVMMPHKQSSVEPRGIVFWIGFVICLATALVVSPIATCRRIIFPVIRRWFTTETQRAQRKEKT